MKMNMKKIMAVLCAMLMICALAACGDDKGGDTKQSDVTDGPSAFELYTQASEKMNNLDSAEYNLNIGMKMDVAGQAVDMTMGGNMKQVKTGEADTDFDLAFNMNMDMSAMGAGAMDVNMYYTNGYLYYDMGEMGQMKVAMDMAAAEEQMNVEGMAELEESWVKDSSVNGNTIHLVVDGTQMTEYADMASSSMAGLSEDAMTIGDVTIDLTTDADGMPTTYKMLLPITVNAEGQTMTMDMDMTMDLVATEGVTIDFPEGMDTWQEVDASMLQ